MLHSTLPAALGAAALLASGLPGVVVPRAPAHTVAKPRVVPVVASDYAFQAPDTVQAGLVTLQLSNVGQEPHHLVLVRLAPGRTFSEFVRSTTAAHGEPPRWAEPVGGPNAILPGGSANATLNLAPGNYALLCMIPSPDGKTRAMKGMQQQLTVVPAARPSTESTALPAADVQMTLRDYGFTLSKPLAAGRQVVRVRNASMQPHEVLLVRLAPGKTAADFATWAMKMSGPPPAAPVGGVSPLAPGYVNDIALDLTPGEYGLVCFVPDAKDGKPHFVHGMKQNIRVM